MDAVTITILPRRPAPSPNRVTPPFVPRGTLRRVRLVINRRLRLRQDPELGTECIGGNTGIVRNDPNHEEITTPREA